MPTRAQQIGCKPEVPANQAKRRLNKVKEHIDAAVVPYGDSDSNLEIAARDLTTHVDELIDSIDSATE